MYVETGCFEILKRRAVIASLLNEMGGQRERLLKNSMSSANCTRCARWNLSVHALAGVRLRQLPWALRLCIQLRKYSYLYDESLILVQRVEALYRKKFNIINLIRSRRETAAQLVLQLFRKLLVNLYVLQLKITFRALKEEI